MWIVFRDPKTIFNHLDKVVLELVDDADIGAYQRQLHATLGGHAHFIHEDVYFLQPFVTSAQDVEVFVRKYKPWSNAEAH
jgi:hypothetical protein